MKAIKNIGTKINQLTPGLMDELEHYLDYLINKNEAKQSRKLTQDWAGGLKEETYSSIELQKKHLIQ